MKEIRLAGVVVAVFMLAICVGGATSAGSGGMATFTVTTTQTDGRFAPRHVIAIWVSDGSGKLVKTLEVKGAKYGKHLRRWVAKAGTNELHAVTGATLKVHQTHTVTWDCRDSKGNVVPDGEYRINVEFTEANGAGPSTPEEHVRFVVGPIPVEVTPGDLPQFHRMSVKFVPAVQQGAPRPVAEQ
jgi:hypothetical protein